MNLLIFTQTQKFVVNIFSPATYTYIYNPTVIFSSRINKYTICVFSPNSNDRDVSLAVATSN